MNINQISNTHFRGTVNPKALQRVTTFRVPGKDGTTVVTNMIENSANEKLVNLKYTIMHKGKAIEERVFQNKKGFTAERLCNICENIQKKVQEGFDFLDELLKAQVKGGN